MADARFDRLEELKQTVITEAEDVELDELAHLLVDPDFIAYRLAAAEAAAARKTH